MSILDFPEADGAGYSRRLRDPARRARAGCHDDVDEDFFE